MNLQSPLQEAGLAALRIVVLAIIPILIEALEKQEIDWRIVAVTAAVALLKAVDEYIHTLGKNEGDPSLLKGLTRF